MARPKKTDEEKAGKVLPPIRITADQDDKYRKAAKDNGFALSAWVKKTLDKAVEED